MEKTKSVGLFDVLKALSKGGKNIKACYLSENLEGAKMGGKSRNGWGSVTIAVENGTIHDLLTEKPLQGMLIMWDPHEYAEAKTELEKELNDPPD